MTVNFSGRLGGVYSQLSHIALAHDDQNEIVVMWTGMTEADLGATEILFRDPNSGRLTTMVRDVPVIVTKDQAVQAINEGAKLQILRGAL